ncbi:MAG: amidohydrolase [Treponema sp.]|jgi:predicted TIM-barrel fold metal-dependent hydrolase|nr:amidohydrolase [Treponema sp.]
MADLPDEVIDCHVHIFQTIDGFGGQGELRSIGNGRARWVTGGEIQVLADKTDDCSYPKLLRLMEAHNISRAIMLQGPLLGFQNEYVHEAQTACPGKLFGMGVFDPYAVHAGDIMRHFYEDWHFLGFKFEVSESAGLMGCHPDFELDGRYMRPVWEYSNAKQLPVSIDMGTFGEKSMQIDRLANAARSYPDVRIVVEHLFFPHRDHYTEVEDALKLLAPFDNVWFTSAALANSIMPEAYPYPSAIRYLQLVKQITGCGRLLWGSDIPLVLNGASYKELLEYIADARVFTDDELENIYGKNAKLVYRLP